MKRFLTLLTSLLLLISSNSAAVVEGYAFNASRFASKPTPAPTAKPIPYETIKHHTRHKQYHSALNVTREISTVTISFHTKQELVELRGPKVNGFSRVRNDGTCEIHVMMPYNWNDDDAMRTVGHELMHCFGAVHEKSEQKKEKRRSKATPQRHQLAQQLTATHHNSALQLASRTGQNNHYKMPRLVVKQRESHF